MTSNLVGLALGILLVVLAFLPGSKEVGAKDGYLPHLIGSLGIVATLLAISGLLGAYFMSAVRRQPTLLRESWFVVQLLVHLKRS